MDFKLSVLLQIVILFTLDEKWNILIEEMCMTGLNFRHYLFYSGNMALSSTKHNMQDGSYILMQDTRKIPYFV